MTDEFKTILHDARAETRVQGSRFIGTAHGAVTKAEAEQFIAKVKKEFFDATHNCYAYRLGTQGNQFRFNDDGEPSGSAGKPILAAIDSCTLTNVVVVVTRYFWGTKLGTGGLARAYGQAAGQVLLKGEQVTEYVMESILATFPHERIGSVMRTVSKYGAKIFDTSYDEEVHLRVKIRKSKADEFKAALVNATGGNITLKSILEKRLLPRS
jgi:uncharacterized YigZ family protein